MQEVWKDIKGYEGIYQVSNFGNVKSLDRADCTGRNLKGKLFSTKAKKNNYITVRLLKNAKITTFSIHRLVALAFLPLVDGKNHVNHKDGNKQNNHVDNLEWCNMSENMKHAYKHGLAHVVNKKLSDTDLCIIKELKGNTSGVKLAKIFGVSFQKIYQMWGAI